jgi:aldose sugar dehydrogenase
MDRDVALFEDGTHLIDIWCGNLSKVSQGSIDPMAKFPHFGLNCAEIRLHHTILIALALVIFKLKNQFITTMPQSLQRQMLSGGSLSILCLSFACSFTPAPARDTSSNTSLITSNNTAQGYRKTTLVEGLERPWGMAWLPDGDILITEKAGRIRRIRNGKLEPAPIQGVPPVMANGQGGLLDIALHPQFAKNRWVYFTYAHGTPSANHTLLARAKLTGQSLKNLQVIFKVSQIKSDSQHFGSRILWLPDGTMLLAIGDGGNPPIRLAGDLIRKQAQNLRSSLGKILRINADGSIPSNNPFVDRADVNPAIWSYGHRNIQGLASDSTTRQIWSTEHGARGGDELNLIERGKNYGWPLVTYSQEYFGGEIAQERSRPGMVDPKQVWTPSIAPSGLVIYRGERFPGWQGNLFAGGLVSQDVRRLRVDSVGKVQEQEQIVIGQRVRDVRQGPDGLLYILTDDINGRLIRLEPNTLGSQQGKQTIP